MRLALLQLDAQVGDVAGNARAILAALEQAVADAPVDLAVTGELSLLGYPAEDLVARDDVLDACDAWLAWLAQEANRAAPGTALVVGLPARTAPATTIDAVARTRANRAVVLQGGRVVHHHDKVRLPDYGVFDESRHFAPGPAVTAPADLHTPTGRVRAGLVICEDLWATAPGPADVQAAAGAEVLVVPNASPWHLGKPAQRLATVLGVARRTGVPVAYVNQVGATDDLLFDGRSMLVWPDGTVVVADAWRPDVLVVELDDHAHRTPADQSPAAALSSTRAVPVAALTDDELADTWQALVAGLRGYMDDCGFTQLVLGLSGGIDSAVCAALAADAVGGANVVGLAMPSPHSSQGSLDDAVELAARCGIELHTVPIAEQMAAADDQLAPLWGAMGVAPHLDVTEENIQARLRGLLLMAVSNKTGRMLLTTGNKSEAAVGYATLYGDMAGGYAPLLDVPKTLVFALARWRNDAGADLHGTAWVREPIPLASITKPPSAELAPDQADTDSLPDYPLLDAILQQFIELDRSREQIVADLAADPQLAALTDDLEATVERVLSLVLRAEYKRRQAPPGPKVTPRAFLRDRRLPIASRWRAAVSLPPQAAAERAA